MNYAAGQFQVSLYTIMEKNIMKKGGMVRFCGSGGVYMVRESLTLLSNYVSLRFLDLSIFPKRAAAAVAIRSRGMIMVAGNSGTTWISA